MFTVENLLKALKDPISAILFLLGVNRYFSQAGEDIVLNALINKDKGFYIDIGANHPINGSNTYLFYQRGWHGINIEPNKKMISKFYKKRNKDTNLQIGVGKNNEDLTFYIFSDHQMSTCDQATMSRYVSAGHKMIDQYTVPIRTLESICDEYIKDQEIDILSVDVEGFDMDVLESNNWNKYSPKYIVLETVEYGKNGKHTWNKQNELFDPYLLDKGYEVIAQTSVNTIYKRINI